MLLLKNNRRSPNPITIALRDIAEIFSRMGFGIAYGPELEDEFFTISLHSMSRRIILRVICRHLWIKDRPDHVLRTHTTSVTIRELEKMATSGETEKRMLCPGKVFRNEATDATHEAQFYQFDGFAVGPKGSITLAHLKGTFERFYREYFGPETEMRFRPSFFPFVEPGVEMDVWFQPAGKEGKWLEMGGAGMLHPNVFKNAGLDPDKMQGFAFRPAFQAPPLW